MLIELCGLPGAGKTTVVDSLLSQSSVNHYYRYDIGAHARSLRGRLRSFADCVIFARRFPGVATIFLWGILRKRVNLRCATKVAVQYKVSMRQSVSLGLQVADQWLLQELWSILLDSKGSAIIGSAVSRIVDSYAALSVQICLFETDIEAAAHRIANRSGGASRYERMEYAQATACLEKDGFLLLELIEMFERAGGRVTRINAGEDVTDKVRYIREIDSEPDKSGLIRK